MSCEWIGKTIRKKSDPKIPQNGKNQSEFPASEQKKTTSEKANFCSNNHFSLYFKIRVKKCTTTRFFAPFPVSA